LLALKNKEKRKKQKISISVLILFFLEFNLVISNAFGRNEILTENWTEDIINRQIDILTQVLTIERETIDLIEEEL